MSQLYFKGRKAKDKEIESSQCTNAARRICQQYLYHYTRLHKQGHKD